MKAIEITKTTSSRTIIHHIVLTYNYIPEEIDDLVEDWCDIESSGRNSGFTYKWEFVEDKDKIKQLVKKEYNIINDKIEALQDKKRIIEKELENGM